MPIEREMVMSLRKHRFRDSSYLLPFMNELKAVGEVLGLLFFFFFMLETCNVGLKVLVI